MQPPIDLREAWQCLASTLQPLGMEHVPLAAAAGRVLAGPAVVDRDQPPFDRAAMDGFAVRAALLGGATNSTPVQLPVVGEAVPGTPWPRAVGPAAIRIMTGAPVPPECDTVVPVEETSGFGTAVVAVRSALPAGSHIVRCGEERRAGEPLFGAGHRLRGADLGMLAAIGTAEVAVGRQPRVAVLVTGGELVPCEAVPGAAQIRDANGPLLGALARPHAAGLTPLGIVPDDLAALEAAIGRGLQHDVLLVSGGVSMGEYDLVTAALASRGVRLHFHRVAIQPGKPTAFGTHAGGCVLALPGNPVSAFTAFRLLAAVALRHLEGETAPEPRWQQVPARFAWERAHRRWIFVPGRLGPDGVERVPYAGSGDLLAYARANGQIVLAPEVARVTPGAAVAFWPL